jgi:hypothetical protein
LIIFSSCGYRLNAVHSHSVEWLWAALMFRGCRTAVFGTKDFAYCFTTLLDAVGGGALAMTQAVVKGGFSVITATQRE